MKTTNENPLTEGELQGAAHLCLKAAMLSYTDRMRTITGSNLPNMLHHQRKERFEETIRRIKYGTTSLPDLGLLPEDCEWAVAQADKAKDPSTWLSHFQAAKEALTQ